MKLFLKFGFLTLFSTMLVNNAWAEYCWMVGCEGHIGYIRIPAGQIDRVHSQTIKINNETYNIDDTTLLFKKPGLPEINNTVVLNRKSSLASNWRGPSSPINLQKACNSAIDNKMKAVDYEMDAISKIVKLHEYWDDFGGGLMREGSVVKVLKYATCKIDGVDATFALVEVIKD